MNPRFKIVSTLVLGLGLAQSAHSAIIQRSPYIVSYSSQTDDHSKSRAIRQAQDWVLNECAMAGCTDCSVYRTSGYYSDYIKSYVGEAWAAGCRR